MQIMLNFIWYGAPSIVYREPERDGAEDGNLDVRAFIFKAQVYEPKRLVEHQARALCVK